MSFWAVACVVGGQEVSTSKRLEKAGFESFVPKTVEGPLFKNYIFALVEDRWRAIESTVGVINLIRFGEAPARCPDREIEALKARVDEHGFVTIPERPNRFRRRLAPGVKVTINGIEAIYAGQSARDRQKILISLLGRQMEVELHPLTQIHALANPTPRR